MMTRGTIGEALGNHGGTVGSAEMCVHALARRHGARPGPGRGNPQLVRAWKQVDDSNALDNECHEHKESHDASA